LHDVTELKSYAFSEPEKKENSSGISALTGKQYTPKQHLLLVTADDWEEFLVEWGTFQKNIYKLVTRLGGAFDKGIDVACFLTDDGFQGEWHNFQCKYYKGDPLTPRTAVSEIGKILWHIHSGEITAPSAYYFFAPKDCGPSLKKLLLNISELKKELISKWDDWCSKTITSTQTIALDGNFETFVRDFDFSIFKYKPLDEVIEEHRKTPYFAYRFGGGIPNRPPAQIPPAEITNSETRYVAQLHEAYADHRKKPISEFSLEQDNDFKPHFDRQRESFYSAESLRTFARDSVPPGTYEALQNEMYDGVVDTAEAVHSDGYQRLTEVLKEAKSTPLDSNALVHVTKVKDRFGICHQLANENKLIWVKKDG